LATESGKRAEDAEKDFLGDVEGLVAIAKQVEGEAVNHPLVSGDQFGTGRFIAGGAALDERSFARIDV
jgi:hypothetical protein